MPKWYLQNAVLHYNVAILLLLPTIVVLLALQFILVYLLKFAERQDWLHISTLKYDVIGTKAIGATLTCL